MALCSKLNLGISGCCRRGTAGSPLPEPEQGKADYVM